MFPHAPSYANSTTFWKINLNKCTYMRIFFGLLHLQLLLRKAFEFRVMPMSQLPSVYLNQGKNGFEKALIITHTYLNLMDKHWCEILIVTSLAVACVVHIGQKYCIIGKTCDGLIALLMNLIYLSVSFYIHPSFMMMFQAHISPVFTN